MRDRNRVLKALAGSSTLGKEILEAMYIAIDRFIANYAAPCPGADPESKLLGGLDFFGAQSRFELQTSTLL